MSKTLENKVTVNQATDGKEAEINNSGDTYVLPIYEDGTIGTKEYL